MTEIVSGGLLSGVMPAQKETWVLFAGVVTQDTLRSFFTMFSNATQQGYTLVHCLFQSTGGTVSDGIALYNFFRNLPIEVRLYNVGAICSAGVIAYLGAQRRIAAENSAFMIHRTQSAPLSLTSERMSAAANSLILDDARTEAILKAETTLATKHWETHKVADLWFDASEAKTVGIVTEIATFAPRKGEPIFFI
ncbi:MAG: peptidase [Rhizobium sp.]|nr:peptidase [Rhizobium sp.]